jgi:hypothetical protein
VDPGTYGGEDQAPDTQDDPAQQEPRQAEDPQGWVQLWAQEIMMKRKGCERRRRITRNSLLGLPLARICKRLRSPGIDYEESILPSYI